ncbi:sucrase ferredoxin [Pseudonocardia nigra]|uniref:sucrase ferredoxin n=1 Tax=Pseudonocardia nigra TaxID=1921578 RepID=UPI0027E2A415|nr:sucrase ferredoxin [Pseudonocardia nigra]
MTAGRPRCSLVAEAAGDPLEGTAPPAARWFLVEHPGPWGRVPLAQSGIDGAAVDALSAWAVAQGGRVVLVRRPGRPAGAGGTRRWFRVDSRPGHETISSGRFTDEAELVEAVDAPGEPHPGPLHLVCTHGRHDTCCAVRGRPLAAALAAADRGAVWECSHIGGCRFAPALVLLPHGYTLGGVPPAAAATVAQDYRAGLLDARWLRGRSSLPPAVQAAQHHARAATGALGVDALQLVDLKPDEQPDGSPGWRVELGHPDCSVVLHERTVATGRPLTCAATAPGRMRVFDLVELTIATDAWRSPG